MKAREFLVSKGLAKEGRGKFSVAAKEALVKAIGEGISFDDYDVNGKIVPVAKPKTVKPKKAKAVEPSYDTPEPFWPMDRYKAHDNEGREVSMKNACQHCGLSLQWCPCPTPRVVTKYGSQDVTLTC